MYNITDQDTFNIALTIYTHLNEHFHSLALVIGIILFILIANMIQVV